MAFQSFGLAALIYLAVSFALVAAFRRAERWLAISRRGRLALTRHFLETIGQTMQTTPRASKLIARDIHKRYGDNEVLKGVSLTRRPAT
jgi:hypothetical protein